MLNSRCGGCSELGPDLCRRCRFALVASPPVVTRTGVVAATEFSGLGRELVVGLKYRNRRRLAAHLAEQLSRRLDPTQIDVITWAPTTRGHVRRRGYDQAELLARALAALWRKPCRRMLFRRHGPTQTGRSRAERLLGPDFDARPMPRNPRVLVVDDVVTTGSTLIAARDALLAAGARSVVLAAVAATPDHVVDRPNRRSTSAMAGAASSSTSTPTMPTRRAASTFDSTSSRKTTRSGTVLSLVAASS
jgi:predicted amidophosphoribosyltransferase